VSFALASGMRWSVLIGVVMVTAAAGCPLDSRGDADSYLLVVESATLSATAAGGMTWCPSALETRVAVTVDGVHNETPLGTGLAPRFDSGVLDAPAADFSTGVHITLLGRCDGSTFTIGSLWVHPPVDDIRAGTLFLVAVGPDALVRIRFQPSSFGTVGNGSGVPGGGGIDDGEPDDCADGSCVFLDPGSPPPDEGDPGDDGGDCGCDDGSDPGDPGDPGGGDDGGGDGGGGDGFAQLPIFSKLQPNPAGTAQRVTPR